MSTVKAWAALEAGQPLQPYSYELDPVGPEEVEVEITHCGLCHTDLNILKNEGGFSCYPAVCGHEIVGRIIGLGAVATTKGLKMGQVVGVGWFKETCQHCDQCLAGSPQLCTASKGTIIGNYGGFASRIKTHWLWAIPVPDGIDAADAGPLFCAGITVFSPLVEYGVRPTDRVAVFGIGGLGHLAVQFCHAWGSHVTAFSSTISKSEDIKALGADVVVSSRDSAGWSSLAGTFDLIIVTVAVPLMVRC
jgi:alcohol/geraniol dehydrogenase (NADP+)